LAKPKSLERLGFGNETSGIGGLLERCAAEVVAAGKSRVLTEWDIGVLKNFTIYWMDGSPNCG